MTARVRGGDLSLALPFCGVCGCLLRGDTGGRDRAESDDDEAPAVDMEDSGSDDGPFRFPPAPPPPPSLDEGSCLRGERGDRFRALLSGESPRVADDVVDENEDDDEDDEEVCDDEKVEEEDEEEELGCRAGPLGDRVAEAAEDESAKEEENEEDEVDVSEERAALKVSEGDGMNDSGLLPSRLSLSISDVGLPTGDSLWVSPLCDPFRSTGSMLLTDR